MSVAIAASPAPFIPIVQAVPGPADEPRLSQILAAVNSCTTQPLSEDDVRKMVQAAKDHGPVAAPYKLFREQGLARNIILTPDGKCRILMTLTKRGDKVVSDFGNFKIIKKQVVIDLFNPNAEPVVEALGVCKQTRCNQRGLEWYDVREDFATEARLLAKFRGQEAVVQITFCAQYQSKSYLGMELCDGDLFDVITSPHLDAMPYLKKLAIVRDCALGLAAVHGKDLIYRDLKPENFLLKNDKVKLTDLGLACRTGDAANRSMRAGTAIWLSPERAAAYFPYSIEKMVAATVQTSDLFPLGEIAFCLFNAKKSRCFPFQGLASNSPQDKAIVIHKTGTLQDTTVAGYVEDPAAAIPNRMQSLIKQMVKCNPADRIQSADHVVEQLDDVIAYETFRAAGLVS